MTKEQKNLLITDLCGRLPHWINIITKDGDTGHIVGVDDVDKGIFNIYIPEDGDNSYFCSLSIDNFKPYLRSMPSMTEKERDELEDVSGDWLYVDEDGYLYPIGNTVFDSDEIKKIITGFDWLNKHCFDYRELIEMEMALDAPDSMYCERT